MRSRCGSHSFRILVLSSIHSSYLRGSVSLPLPTCRALHCKSQYFRFLGSIPHREAPHENLLMEPMAHSHSFWRYLELSRSRIVLVWPPIWSPFLLFFGNIAYNYLLFIYLQISYSFIIKRDNWLLDKTFGKLKRFPTVNMSSFFNSNAEFWPKN